MSSVFRVFTLLLVGSSVSRINAAIDEEHHPDDPLSTSSSFPTTATTPEAEGVVAVVGKEDTDNNKRFEKKTLTITNLRDFSGLHPLTFHAGNLDTMSLDPIPGTWTFTSRGGGPAPSSKKQELRNSGDDTTPAESSPATGTPVDNDGANIPLGPGAGAGGPLPADEHVDSVGTGTGTDDSVFTATDDSVEQDVFLFRYKLVGPLDLVNNFFPLLVGNQKNPRLAKMATLCNVAFLKEEALRAVKDGLVEIFRDPAKKFDYPALEKGRRCVLIRGRSSTTRRWRRGGVGMMVRDITLW